MLCFFKKKNRTKGLVPYWIFIREKNKVQNDQSVTPSRDKEEEGKKISTTRIEVKTKSGLVAILEYGEVSFLGEPKEVNSEQKKDLQP